MNHIDIYTDGACKGNPGPGGWGVLLKSGTAEKELFGGELVTTNNRMELMAVIEALRALKRPCAVTLYIDSQYVLKGVTEWMTGLEAQGVAHRSQGACQERGSVAAARRSPRDAGGHKIDWQWVRGHTGHEGNERADLLANRGVDQALGRR